MSSETTIPSYKKQQNATEILKAQQEFLRRLYNLTAEQNEILRDPMSGLDNCIVRHQVRVKIEDINMPFSAMVGFMIKVGVASIPAIIILWIIFVFLGAMILGLAAIAISSPGF